MASSILWEGVGWLRLIEEHLYVGRRFVTKNPGGHLSGN